jgi:exodeoxyribonuclease-5
MTITLTDEQQAVHDSVIDWYRNRSSGYISVGGLAGSGKTTLIGFITETIREANVGSTSIAYVTYTGKASTVLNRKIKDRGPDDYCGTIHSLIYKPVGDPETNTVEGWTLQDSIAYDLIVLDEASMVGKDIWDDLLGYGVPILAVGDHGQLPPIGSASFSLMKKPDLKLKTIHRQALENPIIRLSMIARKAGRIPAKVFGPQAAKFDYSISDKARDILHSYRLDRDTQILCGMNKTRVKLNNLVRTENGIVDDYPIPGEKLICLKNNKKLYVMNGHMGRMVDSTVLGNKILSIKIRMDGDEFDTDCLTHRGAFGHVKYDGILTESYSKDILHGVKGDLGSRPFVNVFDFGYAISVHKSQGSEFRGVILVEERNSYQSDDDYARWLYTGITRASEKLVILENFY